ncbi:hypothetical protein BDN70DRAFT_993503 [Pholiota conissans]|uniref:Uncharacterized protein n=1 Tax=Pholiota conissans TaxID=109636 RepID=A0A9P5Z319_9AGAR|nr:hypothetical protein BDN70DRAFT_993503 [Pholiota conissans]
MSLLKHTGIQHLALELIQEIIDLCSIETHNGVQTVQFHRQSRLLELRRVSRQFKFATDPFIFKEVTFNFFKSGFVTAVSYLEALANFTHPACRHAITLRIESLPDIRKVQEFAFSTTSMDLLISKAIISLENVRTVIWDCGRPDYSSGIVDALFKLPRFDDLRLIFDFHPQNYVPETIPLCQFRNLRSLDISGSQMSVICSTDFANQLRAIFENGGSLSRLGLTGNPSHGFLDSDVQHVLHQIVQDMPPEAHLELQHLRLDGYCLRFDSITVPHLRKLTSLNVSNTFSSMGIGAQKFWKDLTSAAIFIKDLVVDEINEPLLDYLRTYAGLENLTIVGNRVQVGRGRQTKLKDFSRELCSVLPLHKESLLSYKGLTQSFARTPTGMTKDSMAALSACKKLHTLVFMLEQRQISEQTTDVRDLIETMLQLPRIKFAQLSYMRHNLYNSQSMWLARSSDIDKNCTSRMSSILTSINVFNDVVGRQNDFCDIMFEDASYIAQVIEGYIKVRPGYQDSEAG